MTVSMARSNVSRIQKAIADLQKKDAAEAKKLSTETSKLNSAQTAAGRTKSAAIVSQKLRDVERAQKAIASIIDKRAKITQQISQKTSELHRYQAQLEKAEQQAAKKLQADLETGQKRLEAQIRDQSIEARRSITAVAEDTQYDVFISHASEDKEAFVRGFAEALREAGLAVWYDEFSLKWGDNLRQSIDKGLAASRFGVVVLSKAFFDKDWPQQELNGLFALEMGGTTRILPIWHMITKDEVRTKSPMLADKLAMSTATMGVDEIAEKLVGMCRPEIEAE